MLVAYSNIQNEPTHNYFNGDHLKDFYLFSHVILFPFQSSIDPQYVISNKVANVSEIVYTGWPIFEMSYNIYVTTVHTFESYILTRVKQTILRIELMMEQSFTSSLKNSASWSYPATNM
jgi:hypothetical protein